MSPVQISLLISAELRGRHPWTIEGGRDSFSAKGTGAIDIAVDQAVATGAIPASLPLAVEARGLRAV
jgi:hypothetical protein